MSQETEPMDKFFSGQDPYPDERNVQSDEKDVKMKPDDKISANGQDGGELQDQINALNDELPESKKHSDLDEEKKQEEANEESKQNEPLECALLETPE